MIGNLQALRAFAAMGVVLYHTSYPVNGSQTSFQGVALFFCISGFIMVYVSRQNADAFFLRRVVRIVPIYWLATVACYFFVMFGLTNAPYVWPILWERAFNDWGLFGYWFREHYNFPDSVKLDMLKSLFFVPYKNPQGNWMPVLSVGWTLNLEMFFYALFAISLKISRAYAPLIVVGFLLLTKAVALTGHPIAVFYGSAYTTCFIYGIACYYLWRAVPVVWCVDNRRLVVKVAAAIAVVFLVRNLYPNTLYSNFGRAVDALILCSTFLAVLLLHSAGVRVQSKLALLLGAASYSIYIFHLTILAALQAIADKWPLWNFSNSFIGMAAAMLLSALAGVVMYKLVEVPLAKLFQWLLRRQPSGTKPALAPQR